MSRRLPLLCASILTAIASIVAPALSSTALPVFHVRNDPGGHVVDYDLRRREMAQQGRPVRFSGRCDSACTLYLALPSTQTCVARGARFGFHLPFGGDARANEAAREFMLATYPQWVRDWIMLKGGLTHRLKVMTYDHANRFIPRCEA